MESGESFVEDEKGRLPAHRLETPLEWGDLVLPPESRDTVDRIADPKGEGQIVLFRGPSGTGKTMVAALLGKALGRPVWGVDLSAIAGKYIGETEKALDRLFDAAEAAGAILVFDEADALFGKRTQVKDAHDRYADIEVEYLLQRLEGFRGLAIFVTECEQDIDPAFIPRFRFVVGFPMPDSAARLILWRQALSRLSPDASVDVVKLALEDELSGGDIVNVARRVTIRAAGAPISAEQLQEAIAVVRVQRTKASAL